MLTRPKCSRKRVATDGQMNIALFYSIRLLTLSEEKNKLSIHLCTDHNDKIHVNNCICVAIVFPLRMTNSIS